MKGRPIYILSIETSGKNCSVMLANQNQMVYYSNIEEVNQHDRMLATLISEAMNEIDGDYRRLNAVAVSSGPGSFTGLRIGVSLAKGLTFGTDIKLIAVPTLEAIAYWSMSKLDDLHELYLCPLVHSHKDFFYTMTFNKNFEEVESLRLVSVSDLNFESNNILYVGPGLTELNQISKFEHHNELNAKMVSRLANKFYKEEKFVAPDDFIPYYAQEFIPKQMKES